MLNWRKKPVQTPNPVAQPKSQGVRRGGDSPGKGAAAAFATDDWISANTELHWREGAVFLGAHGCTLRSETNTQGRTIHVAAEGKFVGYNDDRHIVTIAGSRAGKSRSVLLANLATYPGSMLVIDPKGDLANDTAGWREKEFGKVFVLDPFLKSGITASASFNPLDILRPSSPTIVEDAGLIADALVPDEPGATDPHWNESARQFIEGIILHVATAPAFHGERNLISVSRCVREALEIGTDAAGTMFFKLQSDMKNSSTMPPQAQDAILASVAGFFDKASEERDSVLSATRRHLHFLNYDQMQKVLTTTSTGLDLRRLKRQSSLKRGSITVYLSLPALRMGTCSRWLRMFVNLALAAFEEEPALKGDDALPVIMCLDEFPVLGYMKTMESAAGQIAGLGCRLWIVLQDLTQLQALYGKRWETFLGNAGIVQLFGNTDLTTLEWMSRRCGTTAIVRTTQSHVSPKDRLAGITGMTDNLVDHPLLTAEEASRFFARDDPQVRQLVLVAGRQPMILHRIFFDKDKRFENASKHPKLRGP